MVGAKTWYPASDERNAGNQLIKAEERAYDQYMDELQRLERLRDRRERRQSLQSRGSGLFSMRMPAIRDIFSGGHPHHGPGGHPPQGVLGGNPGMGVKVGSQIQGGNPMAGNQGMNGKMGQGMMPGGGNPPMMGNPGMNVKMGGNMPGGNQVGGGAMMNGGGNGGCNNPACRNMSQGGGNQMGKVGQGNGMPMGGQNPVGMNMGGQGNGMGMGMGGMNQGRPGNGMGMGGINQGGQGNGMGMGGINQGGQGNGMGIGVHNSGGMNHGGQGNGKGMGGQNPGGMNQGGGRPMAHQADIHQGGNRVPQGGAQFQQPMMSSQGQNGGPGIHNDPARMMSNMSGGIGNHLQNLRHQTSSLYDGMPRHTQSIPMNQRHAVPRYEFDGDYHDTRRRHDSYDSSIGSSSRPRSWYGDENRVLERPYSHSIKPLTRHLSIRSRSNTIANQRPTFDDEEFLTREEREALRRAIQMEDRGISRPAFSHSRRSSYLD